MTEPAARGMDHYQALGVAYGASRAEITRAYRARMKAIHPDRKRPDQRAAAEEVARRLNAAYATLSNPAKRTAYDRTIRADLVQDQVMNRYVSGFYPQAGGGADPFAQDLRREPTEGERRERVVADRSAFVTLLAAFGAIFLLVVVLLLLWAGAEALLSALR
ncbi:MAG: J domain-containing protein [Chloroflexota bacterium]